MKLTAVSSAVVSALMFVSPGCTTLCTEAQSRAEQQAAELQGLRDEVARLKERIGAVEAVQQDLYRQTHEARSAQADDARGQGDRIAELERQVRAFDAARAADREQIVKEMSSRVSDLMRRQPPPARSARAEQGYEHVVESGQTLSAIAAAYKVSVKAIVEANNIRNPNALRAGQKLFIPAE